MSGGARTGLRFARRDGLGRRVAALARAGLGRVAPRIVRVAMRPRRQPAMRPARLVASAASVPAVWRAAFRPFPAHRKRGEAAPAAIRRRRALLRVWGVARPVVHRGAMAMAVAKAVGRALRHKAPDGMKHYRHLAGAVPVRRALMVARPASAVRRTIYRRDAAAVNDRPLAPVAAGGGGRRALWRERDVAGAVRAAAVDGGPRAVAHGGAAPDAAAEAVAAPVTGPGAAGMAGPGDLARWLGTLFGDEARRPPSGVTGFDGRLSPIFPGRKPGF